MMRKLILLTTASLTMLAMICVASVSAVEISFDRYYNNDEVTAHLKSLNKAYPSLTKLESLGKTEEGRDIWMLMINNSKTGSDLDKPGIYVDGTIHGNEIQATEVCLYTAWYLLDKYDKIDKVHELVDSRAFYIIPTVNVDSRARFFEDANSYGIGRTARVAYDSDNDGLLDEDGPDDLDGDGEILRMRIRDEYGGWKTDPDDSRNMIRTKPWEKSEWRRLGEEGYDNDGDGDINEDGVGYLDMNRNYGFSWQPPYVQSGAGNFPMSAKPNKAISDFVISKPNICFDFAFHNMGGLIVRGPGSKLAGTYPRSDVEVYDFFGHEGEKILPGYKYIIGGMDMYTTHGDFDEFMYSNLGIFGFVGELFFSEKVEYLPKHEDVEDDEDAPSRSIQKHKFDDFVSQGTMFRDWKKFDHPQLGEIEIGGWRPFTSRIPPTFMILEMCHRNASLVLFVAEHTPDISMKLLEVEDIGNGLKRVRIRVENSNALPSLSRTAIKRDIYRQDMITIEGSGLDIVSGGIVRDIHYDRVNNIDHHPEKIFTHIPSFGKRDVQWIVRGSGKATIKYDAVKAGNRSLTISY